MTDIRIVLINTSHPGNIGATARAMKTMGLTKLYLVQPKTFPDQKAIEMASGAVDILNNATIVDTINEAIDDCSLIAGTSARERSIPWPTTSPRKFAEYAVQKRPTNQKTAIIFGRERSGLTNDELQCCHQHIKIASHSDYSSLNLAAAVQIICYELRMASIDADTLINPNQEDYPLASSHELERLFTHLEVVTTKTGFLNPKAPRQVMTRLKRLIYRATPDTMEVNILRGILSSIDKSIN